MRTARPMYLMLVLFLIVAAASPVAAAPAPDKADDTALAETRDLVVIGTEEQDRLRMLGLPAIWKSAAFVLAEWNEEELRAARQASIPFEIIARGFDEGRPLYILELRDDFAPPEEWQDLALHRIGREWIFEMGTEEAREWSRRGYDAVRISRTRRGWDPPAPAVAFACSYDPLIQGVVDQMNMEKWLDWIEKLSGEETVSVGGQEYTILTRYSGAMFDGAENAKGYDYTLQEVRSWTYPPGDIEEDPFSVSSNTWKNIVLTIPGQTSPAEVVLMTGHLDSTSNASIAPGANDNGTGVATLLEAARLLRQLRFERTIKIVWFTGEESGLLGSEAFVSNNPIDGYIGVVNLDMFGYDGDDDRCFEIHAGTMQDSIDVGSCFEQSVGEYGLGLLNDFLTTDATDRSDHASFWQVNVGAIEIAENFFSNSDPTGCVGQDANPNYHQAGDTISQNLRPPFGFDVSRAAVATVAAMAGPIGTCLTEVPVLSATAGVGAVDLSWSPVAGADHYRVYRSSQSCEGQWLPIGEVSGTSWSDDLELEALTYRYHVEAVDGDGVCVSAMSNCEVAAPTIYRAASHDVQILDVCPSGGVGDGNGIIEPGESVLLPVSLRNVGNTDLSAIGGTLSIDASGVQVIDPVGTWPDLTQGQTAESDPNHFGFQVEPGVACEEVFDALIDVSYAEGENPAQLTFTVGDSAPLLLLDEDFAGGIPPSWTVVDGGTGTGPAATWTADNPGGRSIDAPFDEPFAIVDSNHAGSGVSQNEELITPSLDASACLQVVLEFSNQFNEWFAGLPEVCDVDVSIGGGRWQNVLKMTGTSDGYSTPNTKSIDITTLVASDPTDVEIRFHYYNAVRENWWAIDNVRVLCSVPSCTPCASPASPPGEPTVLTVRKDSGDLVFDWGTPGAPCQASGYSLYRGDLAALDGGVYSHDRMLTCDQSPTSFSISESDPQIGVEDTYFLVVAGNGLHEGSYGRDSADGERPASVASCLPAQNISVCVP